MQGWTSRFLFATLDGTISGWAPGLNRNQATLAVDNSSSGAVYTGLAITSRASGNRLYAVNMAKGVVEIYDATFTPVSLPNAFTDPSIPAGFTPFGIRDISGLVYVTYASTNGGPGGFVDKYTEDGVLVNQKPLIQGGPLNQPWGITAAPPNFGPLSNTLLIGNNTNQGTINAFDAFTGQFVGRVKDTSGKAIVINQLWGIDFGDGLGANGPTRRLFFAAGPGNNLAGTFGSIVFKP